MHRFCRFESTNLVMKKLQTLLTLFIPVLLFSASSCGTSNNDDLSPCDEAFFDLTNESWLKDQIVEINGSYSKNRAATDLLVSIKKVTYYDAHGAVNYFVFETLKQQEDPTSSTNCFSSMKKVYDCAENYQGEFDCQPSHENPNYAYSIATSSDQITQIWPN